MERRQERIGIAVMAEQPHEAVADRGKHYDPDDAAANVFLSDLCFIGMGHE